MTWDKLTDALRESGALSGPTGNRSSAVPPRDWFTPDRIRDEVTAAHGWWRRHGSPSLHRFGLTVSVNGEHRAWLDDPGNVIGSSPGPGQALRGPGPGPDQTSPRGTSGSARRAGSTTRPERISDRIGSVTSQTLTFIPARTLPSPSQKAMNSRVAGSPRNTTRS